MYFKTTLTKIDGKNFYFLLNFWPDLTNIQHNHVAFSIINFIIIFGVDAAFEIVNIPKLWRHNDDIIKIHEQITPIQYISERERGLSSKVWDCINIMQTYTQPCSV